MHCMTWKSPLLDQGGTAAQLGRVHFTARVVQHNLREPCSIRGRYDLEESIIKASGEHGPGTSLVIIEG